MRTYRCVLHGFWLSLMLIATSAVAQITPREAQTLSVAELATRALGPAGAIMIAVDRPTWPGPSAGKGDPPVRSLTFYQHPQASYAGEGWEGLCGSLAITVFFGAAPSVTSLETHNVYSVAGDMRRVKPLPSPEEDAEAGHACSVISIGTDRFYAESRTDAATTAIALSVLRHAKRGSKGWPFDYRCRDFTGDCSATKRPADIANIYADGEWEVRTDAPWCSHPPPGGNVRSQCIALRKTNGCFSVSTLYLQVERRRDDVVISRARYEDGQIVC